MVSYYNSSPYSQKHSTNFGYPPTHQAWFPSNYHHTPGNHQFLGDVDTAVSHHHQHMTYYNAHMFHQSSSAAAAAAAAAEWHAPENFTQSTQTHLLTTSPASSSGHHPHQQQQQQHSTGSTNSVGGGTGGGDGTGRNHLNETTSSGENLTSSDGLPSSPPLTVAGSEISSPGAPNASSSPQEGLVANNTGNNNNNNNNNNNGIHHHHNSNSNRHDESPYYDWMKKPSYPTQPAAGVPELNSSAPQLQDFVDLEIINGKTRTKDKYRVVYTDYQRLELEKEYHTSRYITIRRKTELAQALQLSERQVKIWFQNRRAKERKQNKKRDDPLSVAAATGHGNDIVGLMGETKPKLEPGLHLQHSLHQMSSMAMGMPPMGLHHPLLQSGHIGPPPPTTSHHQLHHHQSHAAAAAAAAAAQMSATVGALSM